MVHSIYPPESNVPHLSAERPFRRGPTLPVSHLPRRYTRRVRVYADRCTVLRSNTFGLKYKYRAGVDEWYLQQPLPPSLQLPAEVEGANRESAGGGGERQLREGKEETSNLCSCCPEPRFSCCIGVNVTPLLPPNSSRVSTPFPCFLPCTPFAFRLFLGSAMARG
jgi:hypothetical protein